jgi:dihydrofolate reductase
VFADFDRAAREAGSCVLGRKTYDEAVADGEGLGVETVVLSRSGNLGDGVQVAASPEEAVRILESHGHESLLVGGGDSALNAFLEAGLGDELILNITAELGSAGHQVALPALPMRHLELLSVDQLQSSIVRLHYRLK